MFKGPYIYFYIFYIKDLIYIRHGHLVGLCDFLTMQEVTDIIEFVCTKYLYKYVYTHNLIFCLNVLDFYLSTRTNFNILNNLRSCL